MNRRLALQRLALISAGFALLPACMDDKSKSSILVKNFKITTDQEELLAELSETIIPKTNIPGAKDISAHLFALKMIDDCRSEEDQKKFVNGMKAFEDLSEKEFNSSFVKASPEKRNSLLQLLEKTEDKSDLEYFYKSMKRLTIQAYTSSQFYLTKVKVYELVPARYKGCVPVKTENKLV